MAILPILLHPDPRLKKMCEEVETFDDGLRDFAQNMIETMYDAPGIGLAAPQVGVTKRILVMDCTEKDAEPEPMTLINPKVTWESEELSTYNEGCLSLPEMYDDVTRPAAVKVEFLDVDGAPQEQEFEGLWATCVQHEIDHLNGTLFIDYLSALKRGMITKKMKKLKKERARGA